MSEAAPNDIAGAPAAGSVLRVGTLSTAVVAAALLVLPFLLKGYFIYMLALVFANAIAVIGLSFLLKYGGEISLGHNLFMAVGAYGAAILGVKLGVPFPLDLILAVAISGLVGLIIAFPSRRLSGIYLAVATLALGLTVPELALTWNAVSGGFDALYVPIVKLSWIDKSSIQYFFALILLFLTVGAVVYFRHSRQGIALLLARDHPRAAETFGISLAWCRLSAFGISATITGVSGVAFAYVTQSVAPDSFTFWNAVYVLVGSVVSLQRMNLVAALAGSAFITLLPQYLASTGEWPPILFGAALFLIILFTTCGRSIVEGVRSFAARCGCG